MAGSASVRTTRFARKVLRNPERYPDLQRPALERLRPKCNGRGWISVRLVLPPGYGDHPNFAMGGGGAVKCGGCIACVKET